MRRIESKQVIQVVEIGLELGLLPGSLLRDVGEISFRVVVGYPAGDGTTADPVGLSGGLHVGSPPSCCPGS